MDLCFYQKQLIYGNGFGPNYSEAEENASLNCLYYNKQSLKNSKFKTESEFNDTIKHLKEKEDFRRIKMIERITNSIKTNKINNDFFEELHLEGGGKKKP